MERQNNLDTCRRPAVVIQAKMAIYPLFIVFLAYIPQAKFVDAASLYLHTNARNRLTESKIDVK